MVDLGPKAEILKQINNLLMKIVDKTKGNVPEYDRITQNVSSAINKYKKTNEMPNKKDWQSWSDEEQDLFLEYKKLIKLL